VEADGNTGASKYGKENGVILNDMRILFFIRVSSQMVFFRLYYKGYALSNKMQTGILLPKRKVIC